MMNQSQNSFLHNNNKKIFSYEMDMFISQYAHLMTRDAMLERIYYEFGFTANLSQLKNAYFRLKLHAKKVTGKRSCVGAKNKTIRGFTRIKNISGWQLEHIVLWENVNGKLPKNSYLVFLDGNKQNVKLSNLACVNRREFYFFNQLRKEIKHIDGNLLLNIARLKAKIIECRLCQK